MVDPTSDVGEVDEADAPVCEVCDDPIVNDPDHSVLTFVDADGDVRHRHFCSEDCQNEWIDANDVPV